MVFNDVLSVYMGAFLVIYNCVCFFVYLFVCFFFFLCSMMNASSEGLVLAERSGLNPHTLLDVLVR